ncbi:hypothetical protein O3G_MSEX009634 [Manduca sexta]|uniref:Uncharacterized protein n=1 Tax=Manduca sexta TaxID=7130 RepID=A0A921ZEW4_MANSE|nr:hypothetical protein O3G_MSEX009634 [Manduca sexta]
MLLHYENTHNECGPMHNADPNQQVDLLPSRSETITHILINNNKVLLKTVPVCVHGLNGVVNMVALLDDGSTVSIISDRLLKTLGVRGYKQTMRVRGAWNGSELECNSEIVNLNVSNKDGMLFTLQARSVGGLNLPTQFVSLNELMYSEPIKNIRHLLCDGQCKPEILIGQDNYHLLVPLEITYNKPAGPYVTRTPLGWCVHGRISPAIENKSHHTILNMTDQNGDEKQLEISRILLRLQEVRRSFTIDAMGITPTSSSPRQNSENIKAIEHLERTSVLKDGRWYVGLPWKDITCKMPESYNNAYNRLKGVLKKCKANKNYAARYSERIDHLLRNNYAHEIKDNKVTSNIWYLPHFGVDNPNKKKLRLVFDAAAKSNGCSLNDYLITGPDLLISLYGIMMRFRENKVAVTGDIRDMFLQIKIIPEDQNVLRFLWKTVESKNDEIKTYAMSYLIFGANCSPFIAQFIKNKNAKQYESSKPEAVNAIYKQFYMDDYIDSFEDAAPAIQLIKEISYIHRHGGFDITNWMSNSEEVLNSLPKETMCPSSVKFKIGQDGGERTLGLIWYRNEDELGFDVSFKRIPENIIDGLKRPTKREVLQLVMSIFDVYGFLSPFTIKAKILLQKLWKSNTDWDDEIPDAFCTKWFNWITLLKCLHNVRIPRCNHASIRESETANALNAPNNSEPTLRAPRAIDKSASPSARASLTISYTDLQLHIFCDASTQAMCAAAYWRWINNQGEIQIAFISSKCRVAPVKQMSVPRLELQAALLAARLSDTIIKEHKTVPSEKYFWCDSSTVLHWIRNHERDYKPFVAHRLGEIDELSLTKEWHYVPTQMNVADIATRDTCELSVLHKEWLYGPEFLYDAQNCWPKDIPDEVSDDVLERVSLVNEVISLPVPNPEKFSSWLRLLKTTCIVLSFIDKCKKLTGEVNGDMMRRRSPTT